MTIVVFFMGGFFGIFALFCLERISKKKPSNKIRPLLFLAMAIFGAVGAVVVYRDFQFGGAAMHEWIEEEKEEHSGDLIRK